MYIKDTTELRDKFTMLYEQAKHLIVGGAIDVEVKKHVHKRSNAQNSYYHLMCQEVAKFLDTAGLSYGEYNIPYTGELLHELNKKLFGVKTTTKLSKEDFCDYMTRMIQFWQEKTNWEWMPSELPESYLIKQGYTSDYTRGVING